MTRTLFPYQQTGAVWLAAKRNALLADDMGLGKTAQAITAAKEVGNDVAVICPASLRSNWLNEFRIWWPEQAAKAYITSYEKAVKAQQNIFKGRTLIIDEAHYLKSPKAKRTKAVFGKDGIARHCDRVWALTGTPAPNNPSEMWTLLYNLAPETILRGSKPMNQWTFTRRYCVVKNNGFGDVIVRGQRLDELLTNIKPFMMRRKKKDVLKDLPEIRIGDLSFDAKDCAKVLSEIDNTDLVNLAAEVEKSGADALKRLGAEMATVRRVTAEAKAPLLADWAIRWLQSTDEKLVIFAEHRAAIEHLVKALAAFSPAWIHGSVDSDKRGLMVRRFQQDDQCRVFVGQIMAAGTGLTLTAASTMVFLEQSWVPANNAQAMMRIHRIGQQNNCMVHVAALTGSVDEAVQRVLARKLEDLVKLGLMETI